MRCHQHSYCYILSSYVYQVLLCLFFRFFDFFSDFSVQRHQLSRPTRGLDLRRAGLLPLQSNVGLVPCPCHPCTGCYISSCCCPCAFQLSPATSAFPLYSLASCPSSSFSLGVYVCMIYTMVAFLVLSRCCKWYAMVHRTSLAPVPCVLVLRCADDVILFPSRRFFVVRQFAVTTGYSRF